MSFQICLLSSRAQLISEKWGNVPVVLAGDFNCTPQVCIWDPFLPNRWNFQGIMLLTVIKFIFYLLFIGRVQFTSSYHHQRWNFNLYKISLSLLMSCILHSTFYWSNIYFFAAWYQVIQQKRIIWSENLSSFSNFWCRKRNQ